MQSQANGGVSSVGGRSLKVIKKGFLGGMERFTNRLFNLDLKSKAWETRRINWSTNFNLRRFFFCFCKRTILENCVFLFR